MSDDEGSAPPQGEPVEGHPRLQFFGKLAGVVARDQWVNFNDVLRAAFRSDVGPRCEVFRDLIIDMYDPRTCRFRLLITERFLHNESCVNNFGDDNDWSEWEREKESAYDAWHELQSPVDDDDENTLFPMDKKDIFNREIREALIEDGECTVYLLGALTFNALVLYCSLMSMPVEKHQLATLGFITFMRPINIRPEPKARVVHLAMGILESAMKFQREVGWHVARSPMKLADGSQWVRDVFMNTSLLGLIASHLDFDSFLRLLFMTNGPLRRRFLRYRVPSGSNENDRNAARNRMRVLDFASRIREETGIEYTEGE
jgi:hypothetical protein